MTERETGGHPGVLLAGITAVVSGVSVYLNGYDLRSFPDPVLYTTAKNLIATLVLAVGAALVARRRSPRFPRAPRPRRLGGALDAIGLLYVGVVGGGVAFILFFSGLATVAAEPAAFLHATLVGWVALLAWPVLGERPGAPAALAIGALVAGQVVVAGGVGNLVTATGELDIFGATLLWAVEVIVAKRLLRAISPDALALVRMGGGSVILLADLAATGHLGALGRLGASEIGWALATGLLLAGYVASWFAALARAGATQVAAVLAGSVVVTALLDSLAGIGASGNELVGCILVLAGIVALVAPRARRALA